MENQQEREIEHRHYSKNACLLKLMMKFYNNYETVS